jgi:hypothetical protein
MALSKTIAKDIPLAGIVNVPSYCKVTTLRGTKDMMHATLEARHLSSEGELVDAWHIQFVPDLDGPNFIAQAYAHFKALPQMAGATDC